MDKEGIPALIALSLIASFLLLVLVASFLIIY